VQKKKKIPKYYNRITTCYFIYLNFFFKSDRRHSVCTARALGRAGRFETRKTFRKTCNDGEGEVGDRLMVGLDDPMSLLLLLLLLLAMIDDAFYLFFSNRFSPWHCRRRHLQTCSDGDPIYTSYITIIILWCATAAIIFRVYNNNNNNNNKDNMHYNNIKYIFVNRTIDPWLQGQGRAQVPMYNNILCPSSYRKSSKVV